MSLFEVVEHTVPHKGRVIDLIVDKIKYSGGHTEIREAVIHNGGSVVIGITNENKIILIKQHRYPIDKIIYELPAGKLNLHEDPFEAAKREFEEEVGFKANKWKKLISFYTSPGYTSEILHLYQASDLIQGVQNLEPGEEHILVEEMELDTAVEKILSGEINDGKTIIGILLYKLQQSEN